MARSAPSSKSPILGILQDFFTTSLVYAVKIGNSGIHDRSSRRSRRRRLSSTQRNEKELSVATKDTDDYSPVDRPRSPMMGGAILLGFYVAVYLAVAGVKYILTAPDAMASVATSLATGETTQPERAGMPTDAMRVPLPARMDNARECTPGATSDIKCAYL